ncbi:MAG: CCA tRNA nucleotidyltransferase [Desulfobacteraceae bacterium]
MQTSVSPRADRIIKKLHSRGYKAYIAGGAVRDMVMAEPVMDFDIVTNARLDEIQWVFRNEKVKTAGSTFKICLVNTVEVAACRSGKAGAFFPQSDLERRDFTMNSMAWDSTENCIIDPFFGQRDIAEKIVRFTQDPQMRIKEDPLRMVRACRFAAKLNGRIASDSLDAIQNHRHLVAGKVPFERIRMEILKAMACERPSLFFRTLHTTGLLGYILPCLERCVGLDGGPHHGETVFEHCMLTGDALSSRRPLLRLAGFLHDAGKYDAAVQKNGSLSFPGHEKKSEAILADLETLKFSTRELAYIHGIITVHMRPLTENSTPRAVRRLLAKLEQLGLGWDDFMRMRIADKQANRHPGKKAYTLSETKIRLRLLKNQTGENRGSSAFTIKELAITGREVMAVLDIPPGPRVGEILAALLEKVLDDPALNTPEKLKELMPAIQQDTCLP